MESTIWVGLVEVRQLPGMNPAIRLRGRGAFTWVTCWAANRAGYEDRVGHVMEDYGLFVAGTEQVMPLLEAEKKDLVREGLATQSRETAKDPKNCMLGLLHNYTVDE